MSEAWSQWQGQLIDGKFQLKQYLGGSGDSAVFVAELRAGDSRARNAGYDRADRKPVALRLIADSPNAELQLSRWRMAQDLSHPHLLGILDTGRCRLGEIDLIYAVMEYAEENLAQIVPERPLTAQEAREMLEPMLDALTYLHSRGLVHGHLKPANIMAMGDQLKLASDGICPADQPVSAAEEAGDAAKRKPDAAKPGLYDAPETADGGWSPSSDVWSLGVTLAEVLTQHRPSHNDLRLGDPLLPENLPVEFVEIVRGCLRRDLQLRWTIPAIKTRLQARAQSATVVELGTRNVLGDQGEYQGLVRPELSEGSAPEVPSLQAQSGPLAHDAAPTSAETLRAKPVASAKATMQKPLARAAVAAAGLSFAEPEVAAQVTPARNAASQDRDRYQGIVQTRPSSQGERRQSGPKPAHRNPDSAAAFAIPGKTLLATFIFQTIPWLRRLASQTAAAFQGVASQTKIAVQRLVTQTSRAVLVIATQVEALLRRFRWQTVQRFTLAAIVAFTALAALYASIALLRHKPNRASVHHSITASPKVIIARQEQKPSADKRAAAKPQPGTRQSSTAAQSQAPGAGQPTARQPLAESAAGQPDLQPAQRIAQAADSQRAALQTPAPAAALQINTPDGVRRIDDGGAEEDEPRPAARAPISPANAAIASVDGVQEVMPQVSQSALHTIHGTLRVSVRVKVDPSGRVARAELASAGPSKYFARKSLEAAENWKFAPGPNTGSPLLVHFEFRHSGTRAFATRMGS